MKKLILIISILSIGFSQLVDVPKDSRASMGMGMVFGTNPSTGSDGYGNGEGKISVNVWFIPKESKIGFYLEFGGGSQYRDVSNFYDKSTTWASSTMGDSYKEEKWDYGKNTFGIVLEPHKSFNIIGGIGFGSKEYFHRYYDRSEILGDNGRYWIPADKTERITSYCVGGVYLIDLSEYGLSVMGILVGYDTMPAQLIYGFSFVTKFPLL